ncbi:DMT family transporter [Ottowia thiooxydans]|uniref:DMT family transporter n=1 Tax=Ottowia thiooxydans TaxID=219182 RepID=UPI0003F8FC9D|nr:DMT family transporter [Ottowia thiooxydans]
MRFSPRAIGVLAAIVTVAIWTGFIIIGRASAARTLTPFDIGLCRVLGASLLLLPWGLYLTRRDATAKASSSLGGLSPLPWRQTLMVGFVGGPLYAVLCYAGFLYAPAAHAAVLMPGSLPLWTAVLAFLLLGERFTKARWVGLACIVAGDVLVGGTSLLHALSGGEVWKGDLIFMSTALCWAVYSVLARQYRLDAVRATIAITAFAFCTYIPVFLLLTQLGVLTSHLSTVPWREIAFHMAFQGGGSVVMAGIAFTYMVKQFGPVRSTMITALVPGLSALGAVFFLGEPLGLNLLAGLALVTIGIMFGVRASRSAAAEGNAGGSVNLITKEVTP